MHHGSPVSPGLDWSSGESSPMMVTRRNLQESRIAKEAKTMEIETMGRVLTEATIESLKDLWDAERGLKPGDQVRRVTVPDASVDTGATLLSLPTRLIHQLGLEERSKKRVRSSVGVSEATLYDAVRLTIQGRDCTMDVVEVPDGTPVLIGQLPLEHLDFVVDMRSHTLIGNPAHGGEHMYDLY
jgi:predicted aspartyl protease